jgi:pimeloyl-ACP methyl ester carboxylesterase
MTDTYDPRLSIVGHGEPVVLVPGMDGTGQLFYRQLPLLARSYRVATYALRDSASDMDGLVADLDRVVEEAAPAGGRAIVIGESFGGALAMSLALARPERVAALVILNSFPYFVPHARLRLGLLGLGALPWGAMRLIRRLTASRLHSAHTGRDEIRRFMDVTANTTKQGYVNRLRVLQRYDIRDRLTDLRPPTLFLAAECDHLVPSIAQARFMAARVPNAAVQVLAGHGHICLIAPGVDLGRIVDEWRRGQESTMRASPDERERHETAP